MARIHDRRTRRGDGCLDAMRWQAGSVAGQALLLMRESVDGKCGRSEESIRNRLMMPS